MEKAVKYVKSDEDVSICINWKGVAILKSTDNYSESLKCFEEAYRLDPTQTLPLNNIADSLRRLDRADEALEIINQVLEMDKTKALYWKTKGEILEKLGKHEEAIKCFDKVTELDPER